MLLKLRAAPRLFTRWHLRTTIPRPGRPANSDRGFHLAAALLSHAELNYAGCCANGRNQHFALIARDGISGSPFDMTQSACL
jgi:hypothetical protein